MFAWLGSAFASLLAGSAARFMAMKVILTFVVLTVLPILFNNIIYWFISDVLSVITSNTGSISPYVASFSGLAGWLMNKLRIPEGISIFMSAVAIKYTLGLIPFVRA